MGATEAVLVTGAAGFIGSRVVRAPCATGRRDVVALDDLPGGVRENLPADVRFVHGSILDHQLLRRLFDEHRFSPVFRTDPQSAAGVDGDDPRRVMRCRPGRGTCLRQRSR